MGQNESKTNAKIDNTVLETPKSAEKLQEFFGSKDDISSFGKFRRTFSLKKKEKSKTKNIQRSNSMSGRRKQSQPTGFQYQSNKQLSPTIPAVQQNANGVDQSDSRNIANKSRTLPGAQKQQSQPKNTAQSTLSATAPTNPNTVTNPQRNLAFHNELQRVLSNPRKPGNPNRYSNVFRENTNNLLGPGNNPAQQHNRHHSSDYVISQISNSSNTSTIQAPPINTELRKSATDPAIQGLNQPRIEVSDIYAAPGDSLRTEGFSSLPKPWGGPSSHYNILPPPPSLPNSLNRGQRTLAPKFIDSLERKFPHFQSIVGQGAAGTVAAGYDSGRQNNQNNTPTGSSQSLSSSPAGKARTVQILNQVISQGILSRSPEFLLQNNPKGVATMSDTRQGEIIDSNKLQENFPEMPISRIHNTESNFTSKDSSFSLGGHNRPTQTVDVPRRKMSITNDTYPLISGTTDTRAIDVPRRRMSNANDTSPFIIGGHRATEIRDSRHQGIKMLPSFPDIDCSGVPKLSASPPTNDNKDYFVTTQEWKGEGDLNVKLHEKLELIEKINESVWSMRSVVTGSKGVLPSTILVPFKSLDKQPWFFGNISRRQAEEMLKSAGRHGTFLIRNSESKPSVFSLSVLDGDIMVKHYRIRERDTGGYFLSFATHFATLDEMVSHYSREATGLCARLAVPCAKKRQTSFHSDDVWELNRVDLVIEQTLGKGHFGVVRKGLYQDKFVVAIKELKKGKSDFKEFQTEVNVLKNLNHNRLLKLLGVCSLMEPFYIVTEFLQNGSLLDYLRGPNGRHLDLEEKLHIANQVAEGMAYLESMNYIHRDLAARNVLLDESLNSKIADFGMSKFVKESQYQASSNIRVPIKWTALEALLHCQFSTRSDIWSFGILLSEIMTLGMVPYRYLENSEVVGWLQEGNRMKQETQVDDTCYNIMLECWSKKPENRPTFYQLQNKLTNYIRDVKAQQQNHAFEAECAENYVVELR